MTVEADGNWSDVTAGPAIAVEFTGPTLESTLHRAVEGFADAFADVHPSMVAEHHRIEVQAATPSAMLLAVLEECLRCRRDGRFAVGLADPVVDGEVLRADVDTVRADDRHLQPALAPVVSWHEVTLEPDAVGGWSGRIVAR